MPALFAFLLRPIVKYGGALLALLGVVLGIFLKGRASGKDAVRREVEAEKQALQERVDGARRSDAEVDRRTAAKVAEALKTPPPAPPASPGSGYQFLWPLLLALPLLLAACAHVAPPAAVFVDVPALGALPDCPPAPHPKAKKDEKAGVVILTVAQADAIRDYLARAPGCWAAREAILRGHIEKLENRIRAVSPGQ